jgi:hypothetical protein
MSFVLVVSCLVAGASTLVATATSTVQHRTPVSLGAVVKAFAKSGLPLVNPEAGFMVTTTTLNLANTAYPFTLGVTIYPTVAQAERSFNAGEGPWRKAGYAVAIARNVIVAVVPRGSTLERKAAAKPFAMPAKVAASIARLS